MKDLESLNRQPGVATNAMCTFLAINTSSIQLLPVTALAILAVAHAAQPYAIISTSILATTSGYIGGTKSKPTYEEVSSGGTGHAEAVQVLYDPRKVSYEKLLDIFWHNIDPTVTDRQFCDVGSQYRTAIFVHTEDQRRAAEASKAALDKAKPFKEPIVTPIVAATEFWPAEEYHQDYYRKNPVRYTYYRTGCGRDARLKQLWGSAAPH